MCDLIDDFLIRYLHAVIIYLGLLVISQFMTMTEEEHCLPGFGYDPSISEHQSTFSDTQFLLHF